MLSSALRTLILKIVKCEYRSPNPCTSPRSSVPSRNLVEIMWWTSGGREGGERGERKE